MNKERNSKVEEILGSLDGVKRASMPAFFYTRLKARMETPAPQRPWMLRPVYALAALVVVLLINAAVILKEDHSNDNNTVAATTDTDTLQSIAAEYSLNDNNAVLFEMNQDK